MGGVGLGLGIWEILEVWNGAQIWEIWVFSPMSKVAGVAWLI